MLEFSKRLFKFKQSVQKQKGQKERHLCLNIENPKQLEIKMNRN